MTATAIDGGAVDVSRDVESPRVTSSEPRGLSDWETLHDSVAATVIQAYYPEAVRAGSAARARAQMAQSAVSLFAAGALATLTITSLQDKQWPVKLSACLAIAAWLASAVAYTWAVGAPVTYDETMAKASTGRELVAMVLDRAALEKTRVDARRRWASGLAMLALTATAITVGGAIFAGDSTVRDFATITLTTNGKRAVSELCGKPLAKLEGLLQTQPENARTVTVETDPGSCGRNGRKLILPRDFVTGVLLDGGPQ